MGVCRERTGRRSGTCFFTFFNLLLPLQVDSCLTQRIVRLSRGSGFQTRIEKLGHNSDGTLISEFDTVRYKVTIRCVSLLYNCLTNELNVPSHLSETHLITNEDPADFINI